LRASDRKRIKCVQTNEADFNHKRYEFQYHKRRVTGFNSRFEEIFRPGAEEEEERGLIGVTFGTTHPRSQGGGGGGHLWLAGTTTWSASLVGTPASAPPPEGSCQMTCSPRTPWVLLLPCQSEAPGRSEGGTAGAVSPFRNPPGGPGRRRAAATRSFAPPARSLCHPSG